MKIGIIGAGNIGSVLGRKWAAAGHEIHFGVRNPDDTKFEPLHSTGKLVPVEKAVLLCNVIVLALPGAAVAEFAASYGNLLNNKLVIDATNNVRSPEMHNLVVLGEKAQGAILARAFSTLGWENFAKPRLGGQRIDLFFCSPPTVRPALESLISAIGLRPVYLGDLDTASALDGMTRMWFALAIGQKRGRRIAFKLLEEGEIGS